MFGPSSATKRLDDSLTDFDLETRVIAASSAASPSITLYTSLPPRTKRLAAGHEFGTEYQRECIASWRRHGFNIASLNSAAEIDALLPLDYGVEFIEITSGRPRISDFLATIAERPDEVAGIINGDCMIVANDTAMSHVVKSAGSGLVLIERMNINPESLRPTGMSCSGFDLFLFSKRVLEKLVLDPDITIGTPWWDYWFPVAYRLAGGELFTAPGPILMHLDHPQNWSHERYLQYGRKFHATLAASDEAIDLLPFVGHKHTNAMSDHEIGEFAMTTFEWLRTSPRVIDMGDSAAWLWCSILAGIDALPKEASDSRRGLEEAKRRFAQEAQEWERRFNETERQLAEETQRHREEMERLKQSISWRITRPLRGVEKMLAQFGR